MKRAVVVIARSSVDFQGTLLWGPAALEFVSPKLIDWLGDWLID